MPQKDLEDKVNDIHRAIVGSKEYNHKGLIQRVDDLEKTSDRRAYKATAIGTTIGLGIGALSQKLGLGKALSVFMQFFP
jgi:hypothetical protein